MSMQVRCLICNEILDCNPSETTNLVEHVRKQHPEVQLQPSSTELFKSKYIPEQKEPGLKRTSDVYEGVQHQRESFKINSVEPGQKYPPDVKQERECFKPNLNLFKHGANYLPDFGPESNTDLNKIVQKGRDKSNVANQNIISNNKSDRKRSPDVKQDIQQQRECECSKPNIFKNGINSPPPDHELPKSNRHLNSFDDSTNGPADFYKSKEIVQGCKDNPNKNIKSNNTEIPTTPKCQESFKPNLVDPGCKRNINQQREHSKPNLCKHGINPPPVQGCKDNPNKNIKSNNTEIPTTPKSQEPFKPNLVEPGCKRDIYQQREHSKPNLWKHGNNPAPPDHELLQSNRHLISFDDTPKGPADFNKTNENVQGFKDSPNKNIKANNTECPSSHKGSSKCLYCIKTKEHKRKDNLKLSCTGCGCSKCSHCHKKKGYKCPDCCSDSCYCHKEKPKKHNSKEDLKLIDSEINPKDEYQLRGGSSACLSCYHKHDSEDHNSSNTDIQKTPKRSCHFSHCTRFTGGRSTKKDKSKKKNKSIHDNRESYRQSSKLVKYQNQTNIIRPQLLCRQKQAMSPTAKEIEKNLSKHIKKSYSNISNNNENLNVTNGNGNLSSSEYFDANAPCTCRKNDNNNKQCLCLNTKCDCQIYHLKDQIKSPEKVYKLIDKDEELSCEEKKSSEQIDDHEELLNNELILSDCNDICKEKVCFNAEKTSEEFTEPCTQKEICFAKALEQKLDDELCQMANNKAIYRRSYSVKNPFPFSEKGKEKLYKTSIEKWRPGRGRIFCPSCGSIRRPIIRSTLEKASNTPIGAACIITCWPFCFLPCLFPPPAKEWLHCSNCNYFLGVYDRKNEIIEPAK